jgi:hypothetical protein
LSDNVLAAAILGGGLATSSQAPEPRKMAENEKVRQGNQRPVQLNDAIMKITKICNEQ